MKGVWTIYNFLIVAFIMLGGSQLNGQVASTLFPLGEVPQVHFINPAVQPECKLFIGIPGLSTLAIAYSNSSFSYNDLVTDNTLTPDRLYERLHHVNSISADLSIYPLAVGYKWRDTYFSLAVSEHVGLRLNFPRDLAGLALYGNAQYIGDVARIRNTRLQTAWYREYSLGVSTKFDSYTHLGVRAKLLFGKAAIETGRSRLTLRTDNQTFGLDLSGNLSLKGSLPVIINLGPSGEVRSIELQTIEVLPLVFNAANPGLAFDLGFVHEYSSDITLSGTVSNLGFFLWSRDSYSADGLVDISFNGITSGSNFSSASDLMSIADSLMNGISYTVTEGSHFSFMPVQLYLGGEYKWKERVSFGLVSANTLANRNIYPSISASVIARPLKGLSTTLSWSWMNNSLRNIGAGVAYTGKGLQVYAVTDNLLGYIDPLNTRSVNLRFGMNLLLGCPKKQRWGTTMPSREMLPCPENQLTRRKMISRRGR